MHKDRRQFIQYLGLVGLNLFSSNTFAEKQKFCLLIESNTSSSIGDAGPAILVGVNAALNASKDHYPNIEIVPKLVNHHGNPSRAIDGLQLLAQSKFNCIGIVGGDDGNVSPLVLDWAQSQGLPYGIVWASNPSFINLPEGAVSTSLNDLIVLQSLWLLAASQNKKKWGLLLANDGLGRGVYDSVLAEKFSKNFPELVGVEWHSLGNPAIGVQYQALQNKGADFVFMAAHPEAALSLVKYQTQQQMKTSQSRNHRFTPVVCSSNSWTRNIYRQTQGNVVHSSLIFALPQNFDYTDRHLNSGFAHPASSNAFLLTLSLIKNLAAQANVSPTSREKDKTIARQSFPQSEVLSVQVSPSFMRYADNGKLTLVNPASFFS